MSSDQNTPQPSSRALRIGGFAAIVVAAAVVAEGIISRANSHEQVAAWTQNSAIPSVSVTSPGAGGAISSIELPARFEAYTRAPIHARVNGYLKSWHADIGTRVRAGQLLAVIETPELDQQLLQAKADLVTAQANQALAATTAKRWESLLESGAVSPQEVDEKTGDLTAKEAMVKAAQANVDRLVAMRGFARIVAPFDGSVTARETDVGALINAGSGSGPALFEIADTRRLRLYINVPQTYAAGIKLGTQASISVPEHPGKTFVATVEALSRAVDATSRAMLVQLAINNTAGEFMPGGFATVSLQLSDKAGAFSLPSSALIFDQSGLRVATVDANGKVALKVVTLARDLGKSVEISSGIMASDKIIENPPDGLSDGVKVRIVPSQLPAKS